MLLSLLFAVVSYCLLFSVTVCCCQLLFTVVSVIVVTVYCCQLLFAVVSYCLLLSVLVLLVLLSSLVVVVSVIVCLLMIVTVWPQFRFVGLSFLVFFTTLINNK